MSTTLRRAAYYPLAAVYVATVGPLVVVLDGRDGAAALCEMVHEYAPQSEGGRR